MTNATKTLLAAIGSILLAVPAAAQSMTGPLAINDRQNCAHVTDPALAARIGTLSLSPQNMQAMFGGVPGSDPRMRCAAYIARTPCSADWAQTGVNSLGATDPLGALLTMGGVLDGSAPRDVRQGAGYGAAFGGVFGLALGGKKGGAAGAALGGIAGGVGASVLTPARALQACNALQARMPAEIDAMIRAGALRPVRTDAELRASLVAWRGRLSDPDRIATIDALVAHSDGIAARVARNTGN